MLRVTRPSLPPRRDLDSLLDGIWERGVLTNGGPLHEQLEAELSRYLGIEHIALFANCTLAIMAALKALDVTGEVITSPFSFVASGHALLWCNLQPVFCDIEAASLNLDPSRIEALISPRTTAIMPVHCYGHPCDTDAIAEIGRRHGIKVIYDAAHAFGTTDAGGSVLRHGDASAVSFHATKVFNTFEGGAVTCPSAEVRARLLRLRNFGFADELTVTEMGLNGKMSELHAAVGLCQLPHVAAYIERRAAIAAHYRRRLAGIPGLRPVTGTRDVRENHAFFPVLIAPESPFSRDDLLAELRARGILARRYFYPLISDLPMYRSEPTANPAVLPHARRAAQQVLCLPMSAEMSETDAERVCRAIHDFVGSCAAQ